MSGFIIKAQTQGGAYVTKPLRESYEELVADLADSFNLIPASVTLFSKHNGTQLWVHMGSKSDLDVVLAEAAEYGSHVVNIEVSGVTRLPASSPWASAPCHCQARRGRARSANRWCGA